MGFSLTQGGPLRWLLALVMVTAVVHCVLEVGEQNEGVPRKHGGWEGG